MRLKLLLSLLAGIAAVLLVGASPAMAITFEVDYATGTYADNNTELCQGIGVDGKYVGSGCFDPAGDHFYVSDDSGDKHSVAVIWDNYYQGSLYRQGACVEKNGAGTSGGCNKDFHEGSIIEFRVCTYESGTNTKVDCPGGLLRLAA